MKRLMQVWVMILCLVLFVFTSVYAETITALASPVNPEHLENTASYARRVIFIKDGKVLHELLKGTEERRSFFEQIMDVISLLGGDMNYAD